MALKLKDEDYYWVQKTDLLELEQKLQYFMLSAPYMILLSLEGRILNIL